MMTKAICFITKNYPPQIGGMEQYSHDLVTYFRASGIHINLIANTKGTWFLPLFAFIALFQGFRYTLKSDVLWIGDGSISFYGRLLSKFTNKPWYVTIHALDITWSPWLYQRMIPWFIQQADHVIAVSNYTKQQCVIRGVPAEKITVIPNGINPKRMPEVVMSKEALLALYQIPHTKKILFSLGRHIERKGFHWFLEEVIGELGNEYVYILAGAGKWAPIYQEIITRKGLNNVYLVGRIPYEYIAAFYTHSDLFIMPNIPIVGDAEGFGIVCIEAGWYGLPVIGSQLEGISNAIISGKTGSLLPSGDAGIRVKHIQEVSLQRTDITNIVQDTYHWDKIIKDYLSVLY